MVGHYKAAILLSVSLIGVAWSWPAAAEDPSDRETKDAIIVTGERLHDDTGTKSATPVVETPQSVNVIPREQLEAQAVQSVAQALRYAPGVTSEPRGVMTGLDYFYARGFPLNQYLDGLRTLSGEYSYPQPDPYLLEQIEVLRGPASVLYGQADPGGIVNLVSKRPTADPIRGFEIQAGSYGRIQGGIDLGGALDDSQTLLGRITAVAKDSGTQVDFAKEQRFAVAPALTWQPDSATTLTILGNYTDDPDVGYYNWSPATGTVFPLSNGKRLSTSFYSGDPDFDRWSRQSAMIGYQFRHRFSNAITLEQNLRFAHATSTFRNIYSSFLDTDERTLYRYAWAIDDRADDLDIDTTLRADVAAGALHNSLLFGLDYQHLSYRQLLGYDFATVPSLDIEAPIYHQAIAEPPPASDALQHSRQIGIYAQDQISLGGLRVLLGGRQDWVRTETTQRIDDSGNYFAGVTDTEEQSAFTGRAGLLYLFPGGFAPYVSFTQSFQPQTGTDFAGTPFKPTTGQQWEAGIKYQSPAGHVLFTAAVYDLRQQNVVVTDEAHPGEDVQAGEIRSRGVDLSLTAQLADGLSLTGSYSYLDQKVTKGNVDFGPQLGNTPSDIPGNQASLWVEYAPKWLGGFRPAIGVRYLGSSWGDDDNTFKVPAATLVDAALRYDLGERGNWLSHLGIGINVTNLFDKTYVAGCGGSDYCGYGFRRTVLGTISKSF